MTQTIEITCDTCGGDLASSGNSIDYRIKVASERVPSAGGVVTDMMIYPDFPKALHFCGHRCMATWATGYFA